MDQSCFACVRLQGYSGQYRIKEVFVHPHKVVVIFWFINSQFLQQCVIPSEPITPLQSLFDTFAGLSGLASEPSVLVLHGMLSLDYSCHIAKCLGLKLKSQIRCFYCCLIHTHRLKKKVNASRSANLSIYMVQKSKKVGVSEAFFNKIEQQ